MIKFHNEYARAGYYQISPILQSIVEEMSRWLDERDVTMIITETLTTIKIDRMLNRVSSSHREGRAVDVSVRNIPKSILMDFITHFSEKYNKLGAVSKDDKIRRLIVYRPHGTGPHLHIQIGKDIIVKKA